MNQNNETEVGLADLLSESIQTMASKGKNLLKIEDAKDVLTSDSSFNYYLQSLSEGLDGQTATDFMLLAENSRQEFLRESVANASLYSFASLQMGLIRSVMPRLIGRRLVNHEILKTPSERIGVLKTYLTDPAGNRIELSKIQADSTISEGYKTYSTASLPVSGVDLFATLTSAEQAASPKEIDRKVTVTETTMTVLDTGGINGESVVATVSIPFAEDGSLAIVVTGTHTDGTVNTDTLFGKVDFMAGTISLAVDTGILDGAKVSWRVTNEHNNVNVWDVDVEYKKETIEVDSGRVINMSLPYSYLQDVDAFFSIDGMAQATKTLADAQLILEDREIITGIRAAVDGVAANTQTWDYALPATGISRADHNLELLEKVNYGLANSDAITQFNSISEYNIMGNPVDVAKISSTALINAGTYQGAIVNGQMNAGYRTSQLVTPSGTVNVLSSRQVPQGALYIVPKSSNIDERVMTQFSYSNILITNNTLRNATDPLIKNIASMKRDVLKEFNPQAIQKIIIENG